MSQAPSPIWLTQHPDTGRELHLPPGYHRTPDGITHTSGKKTTLIYPGTIFVYRRSINAADGTEALEIQFNVGQQIRRASLSRHDAATVRGLVGMMARLGAYIHEQNARAVMAYLSSYMAVNHAALPLVTITEVLGVQANEAIVLSDRCVGGTVQYTGNAEVHVGPDPHTYRDMLRTISSWEGCWPLWAVLGWAIISPLLGRTAATRNPVLYLKGPSNVGKSSCARFAQGVWLGTEEAPYQTQGLGSTARGLLQTLEGLRGLPGVLDEVHGVPVEENLEPVIYGFANRQAYSRGTVAGHVHGGKRLIGTLLLAGEANLQTRFQGAVNRLLQLDGDRFPPMGQDAAAGTAEGAERARLLVDAWQRGAGHLGPQVAEHCWPTGPTSCGRFTPGRLTRTSRPAGTGRPWWPS